VRGAIEEVGLVAGVTVNGTTGRLVDGHLRVELAIAGTGTYLDRLALDDFSLVGLDGEVRGGNSRPVR
jgi:hypothetical protein